MKNRKHFSSYSGHLRAKMHKKFFFVFVFFTNYIGFFLKSFSHSKCGCQSCHYFTHKKCTGMLNYSFLSSLFFTDIFFLNFIFSFIYKYLHIAWFLYDYTNHKLGIYLYESLYKYFGQVISR